MPRRPVTSAEVERITRHGVDHASDLIAVEEPLQILLEHGAPHERRESPLAITMRTPGHDHDLVAGFLFAEGVIANVADLLAIRHCARSETPTNVIRAVLHPEVRVPRRLLERNLTMTSACGVCGDRTLDALAEAGCEPLRLSRHSYRPETIRAALGALEASQAWFRNTGGTHAAAILGGSGQLLLHREDVGRHNALDKLVGAGLLARIDHGPNCFFIVSSRASFELVQKAVRARVPMMVAIGAPTSLAIETARRFGVTLVGFAKRDRFNAYTWAERIAPSDPVIDVGAAE